MGRATAVSLVSGNLANEIGAQSVNEVYLSGRISDAAAERVMPSGDVLLVFRVSVDRPVDPSGHSRVKVDTIDCVARRPGVRRTVATWCAGDEVAIEGSLRRRFWKGTGGLASRYEVEVNRGRRVAKAG